MIEKRFHYHIDEVGMYYYICDGGKTEDKIFAEVTGDVKEVTDKLNELSDENKKLKEQVQRYEQKKLICIKKAHRLKEELDYYKAKCASCEEGLFQQDREIARLVKENKELQKR